MKDYSEHYIIVTTKNWKNVLNFIIQQNYRWKEYSNLSKKEFIEELEKEFRFAEDRATNFSIYIYTNGISYTRFKTKGALNSYIKFNKSGWKELKFNDDFNSLKKYL